MLFAPNQRVVFSIGNADIDDSQKQEKKHEKTVKPARRR
jgi:hypothetical protein